MSSIMTNASAMTALKSLQMTNKSLESTQARISTGFRVAEASDNAAYWSIATTMRSDNKAMSTVQDALGLGAAQVDVAYTAMDASKDVLDNIKTKLVAASQPGVDKSKIQSEIAQLQSQLQGIASAATFSGSNWLSVDSSSSDYSEAQKIVSSFARSSDGSVSIATIDVDLRGTALFDSAADVVGSQTGVGLLDKGNALAAATTGNIVNGTASGSNTGPTAAVLDIGTFAAFTLDSDDTLTFDLAIDGGDAKTVTIDKATIDAALGVSTGAVGSLANMVSVMTEALSRAGVTGVTAAATASDVTLTGTTTGAAASLTISNAASSSNGNSFGVKDIDITNATAAQIDTYISGVDKMAAAVTTAASDLGAVKSRISMQKDFVKNLMDAVDRGVGALVDADMNKESTRLQALQVQQQLGIQALSIANGNAQQILSLFR
jgi:flagellin